MLDVTDHIVKCSWSSDCHIEEITDYEYGNGKEHKT
jgi:hypothetical protein